MKRCCKYINDLTREKAGVEGTQFDTRMFEGKGSAAQTPVVPPPPIEDVREKQVGRAGYVRRRVEAS